MLDYDLNEMQLKALQVVNKPVLILAGAGSGKTRVITYKLAFLIKEYGIPPWSILAVTFTNKAAKEMKERSFKLLEDEANDLLKYKDSLWISTFHSACVRILRKEAKKLGFKSNITIYDASDSRGLIKDIVKTLNFDFSKDMIRSVCYNISSAKSSCQSPKEFLSDAESLGNSFRIKMGRVYEQYQKRLFENNAMDFDDLIMMTTKLLEKDDETREYYQKKFQYIMVDEFQDTNQSQYKLIKLLCNDTNSISVVGDDDQSIYSFRGADISNILNFAKDFPSCEIVKLEQNYRSTNNIIKGANSVVAKNSDRHQKKLWSAKQDGEKIYTYYAYEDTEEGDFVVDKIMELKDNEGCPNNSFAIFYRTNAQSRIFEEILRKRDIPYRIFGGIKFYERKEIKDVMAYLSVVNNGYDTVAIKRIINVPKRKIGATTVGKIEKMIEEKLIPFRDAFKICVEDGILKGATKKRVDEFFELIDSLREELSNMTLSEFMKHLLDKVEYLEYLMKEEENFEERQENINELLNSIISFENEYPESASLENFLQYISLQSDIDNLDETEDYVSLMTVHNSKGLEFDNVFVTGLEEGIFPHFLSKDKPKELEEERRLFYVAMTRAKKRLFLSSARQRYRFGSFDYNDPSRFLIEINTDYISPIKEPKGRGGFGSSGKIGKKIYSFNKRKDEVKKILNKVEKEKGNIIRNIEEIKVNQEVFHPKFGRGIILKIDKKVVTLPKVQIKFDSGSKKDLILQFANLSKTPFE